MKKIIGQLRQKIVENLIYSPLLLLVVFLILRVFYSYNILIIFAIIMLLVFVGWKFRVFFKKHTSPYKHEYKQLEKIEPIEIEEPFLKKTIQGNGKTIKFKHELFTLTFLSKLGETYVCLCFLNNIGYHENWLFEGGVSYVDTSVSKSRYPFDKYNPKKGKRNYNLKLTKTRKDFKILIITIWDYLSPGWWVRTIFFIKKMSWLYYSPGVYNKQ